MAPHQRRESQVLLEREPVHLRVLDDVGAVLVEAGVVDVEADLVQLRPPGEHEPGEFSGEVPRLRALFEKLKRSLPDPLGLVRLHVVAAGHRLDGRVPRVLVVQPTQQVVQSAFAQRAARDTHLLYAQCLEHRQQDGNAAGEHRCPALAQALDAAAQRATAFDQQVSKAEQRLQRDALLAPARGPQDFRHRADRARRTDSHCPAGPGTEASLDRLQLHESRDFGTPPPLRPHPAAREVPQAGADATHVEALQVERPRALADDQLRRPATDVHGQAPFIAGEASRHAEVDQPRLLESGDDLHRMPQRPLRRLQQIEGVARLPQGVRAHDADRPRRKRAHALTESTETLERPRRRFGGQAFSLIEPGGKPHELLLAVDEHELTATHFGHDQVKAVGAQVSGGDHLRIRRREGERVLRVDHSRASMMARRFSGPVTRSRIGRRVSDSSPCLWNSAPTR